MQVRKKKESRKEEKRKRRKKVKKGAKKYVHSTANYGFHLIIAMAFLATSRTSSLSL